MSPSSALAFAPIIPYSPGVWRSRRRSVAASSSTSWPFPNISPLMFPEEVTEPSFQTLLEETELYIGRRKKWCKRLGVGTDRDDKYFTCFSRPFFSQDCNKVINELMCLEETVGSVYYMFNIHFSGLDEENPTGFGKFFLASERRQREDAEKLLNYMHYRKGKSSLRPDLLPLSEFYHADQGAHLKALEITQSFERLTYEKLLKVLSVAQRCNDPHIKYFIETELLNKQVQVMKKISEYIDHLTTFGEDGVRELDQRFSREYDAPYLLYQPWFYD